MHAWPRISWAHVHDSANSKVCHTAVYILMILLWYHTRGQENGMGFIISATMLGLTLWREEDHYTYQLYSKCTIIERNFAAFNKEYVFMKFIFELISSVCSK